MKHNWEYKDWKDVLNIINGKNQKSVENPHGKYPIFGSGGIMGYANDFLCPKNCTIIGRKGNINKPIYTTSKFWNVDTAFGLAPSNAIHPRFLFYFCLIYDFEKHNKATTIPSLVKKDLLNIKMPVPPMEVQEQIVAELDKINEVIDDCRELLRNLDALAQSLFYDTFGDPISNPKGWNVKKLSDECLDIVDGDHSAPPKSENGVPFITISNIDKTRNSIDFKDSFFVPQEYYDNLKPNRKPQKGDVLYTVTGSYGMTVMITDEPCFCFQRHIGLIRPKSSLNSVFLAYWGRSNAIKSHADNVATGIAQKTVSLASLRNFPLILPPLALQEDFAAKIEAIEAQKAKVETAIAQLQTLLDSRMDYWFN
ncbi:MAG: restriction endonuclease subunit S [Muribaculaceae bacterium]